MNEAAQNPVNFGNDPLHVREQSWRMTRGLQIIISGELAATRITVPKLKRVVAN